MSYTKVPYYKLIIALFVVSLYHVFLYAQDNGNKHVDMFHNWSKLLSPEKVYLHTDKDVYYATDTIWFSGYVENASYASEFDESNYIYVELLTKQLQKDNNSIKNYAEYRSNVSIRKKIRRTGNNFQGHIVVPEMNSTGRAVIRAYTYWMLNRPAEYMFYKELEITNPMKDKLVSAMSEGGVKLQKDYLRIGELPPDEKKKQEEKEEESGERYDVQFLPESGNSIAGLNAVLYVKAISKGGGGAEVFGEIMDSEDNVVAQYNTDSLGFGRVALPFMPDGRLIATVRDSSGYNGKAVRLQTSVPSGVVINGYFSVAGHQEYNTRDVVRFSVNTSGSLLNRGLGVYLHNGSEIYYHRVIDKPQETVILSLISMTPGIHAVSVIDAEGNVYAERPFIVLPSGRERLSLEPEKERYRKRELVDVKIQIPEELLDSTANFSVSVTDFDMSSNKENTTMQSYMFLKSELNGYIEDIGWYFNENIPLGTRMQRADLLMQTQGWRYYDISRIVQGKSEVPYFGREYSQTLFGKVVNPVGLTKKATVSFLAPSIKFKAMGQIDSGYFVLKDISFPENTRFIVSAVGKNGRSRNHTPVLQNDYFAPLFDYPTRSERVKYTESYRKAVEQIYYDKDDGEHAMAFELDPVVVSTQKITPRNSPSPIPNFPIHREWFRDTVDMKPYTASYDVASYVVATYTGVSVYTDGNLDTDTERRIALPEYLTSHLPADESAVEGGLNMAGQYIGSLVSNSHVSPGSWSSMNFNTNSGGITMPSRKAIVLVYLNGSYIEPYDAIHSVLSLPLNEVESIIYVQGINAAPFQPSSTMKELSPYPVLMVRTKPHVRTDAVPYNVTSDYPLGWQRPVKFYSPKYDNANARRSTAKDNRITLYWNPSVKFDSEGFAYVSFYTSDSDSNYRVEVEGRSAARQYHYAEKIIERVKESAPAKKK